MEKRFVFRGSAVGTAGHIHAPDNLIISHGSSSLPVTGGYLQCRREAAKFGDVLSVEKVHTHTSGDYHADDQAYTTLANSVVKGLNVHGRLTADSLEATLISSHPADGTEPSITPAGTAIVNLRLDGYPVTMNID